MSIGKMGIIGAGQMGAGVAQVAAQAGLDILLNDVSSDLCRTRPRKYSSQPRPHDSSAAASNRTNVTACCAGSAPALAWKIWPAPISCSRRWSKTKTRRSSLFQKLDKICPSRCDLRLQHLVDFHHADGGAHHSRRSLYRDALHESGSRDAPGGNYSRTGDLAGNLRVDPHVRRASGQEYDDGRGFPRLYRQSHPAADDQRGASTLSTKASAASPISILR